jgi:flagellar biosynthesis protein FlhG
MDHSTESLRAFLEGSDRTDAHAPSPGVLVVGSGKGGVGTSVVSVLLAVEAARRGERVLLVDADETVGSLHLMLGVQDPGPGLGGLRGGVMEPEALLVSVASGLVLFPGGGGGVASTLTSGVAERRAMLRRVSGLFSRFSTVIVDGGSRLDSVMAACGQGAERLLCVTSPDRIAIASSYALFKVTRARFQSLPVELIVNRADERKGRGLHAIVRAATQAFLGTDVSFGGTIPTDEGVLQRLEQGVSLADSSAPYAPAPSAAGAVMHRLLTDRTLDSASPLDVLPLPGLV